MSTSLNQLGGFRPGIVQVTTPSVEPQVPGGRGDVAATALVRWYAVYTRANHEKRVAGQLASRSVDHFLPLHESLRQWRDRKVRLQVPLFPGYLFVHTAIQERLRILHVPGVVQLVGCNRSPTPIPEKDIERIREFLAGGWQAEPHPYLQAGRRARVVRGPLEGLEGIVVRRKNKSRLVISIDVIQRSMSVEMDEGDLAPV